jgi:Tfp pilus assembly protein PilF
MWYERALERDPGHPFSHLHLAMVAERLGDVVRAAEHYRAFVSVAPRDAAYDAPRAEAREALARLGEGGPG